MKIRLSTQWDQLRSAASRYFPASPDEPVDRTVELDRPLFDECKALAERLGTSVPSVIREAITQYTARYAKRGESEGNPLSHPLLRLDGLAGRMMEETGGDHG